MSDTKPLSEDVTFHTMAGSYQHSDDRWCQYHQRLGLWVTSVRSSLDSSWRFEQCLRTGHPTRGAAIYPHEHEAAKQASEQVLDAVAEPEVDISRYPEETQRLFTLAGYGMTREQIDSALRAYAATLPTVTTRKRQGAPTECLVTMGPDHQIIFDGVDKSVLLHNQDISPEAMAAMRDRVAAEIMGGQVPDEERAFDQAMEDLKRWVDERHDREFRIEYGSVSPMPDLRVPWNGETWCVNLYVVRNGSLYRLASSTSDALVKATERCFKMLED